jgi:hypothetical protein
MTNLHIFLFEKIIFNLSNIIQVNGNNCTYAKFIF